MIIGWLIHVSEFFWLYLTFLFFTQFCSEQWTRQKNWKRHGHNKPECRTDRKSCWPVGWWSFFQCKDGYVFVAFCFHQFYPAESHWTARWEALSMLPRSCCHFLRFEHSLSVCCSSLFLFIGRGSTAGDRYVKLFTWTVALCLNECLGMRKRWNHSRSRDGFPGWGLYWLLLFQSEPD